MKNSYLKFAKMKEFSEQLKEYFDKSNTSGNENEFSRNNNSSNISKTELFARHEFLCKCGEIPDIDFLQEKKIIYTCCNKCINNSPTICSIGEVFNFLYEKSEISEKSEDSEDKLKKLKCIEHPDEKYSHYCFNCKKNLCNECFNENENNCEHENVIILNNIKNVKSKIKYIQDKIKQKFNVSFIDSDYSSFYANSSDDGDDDINIEHIDYRINLLENNNVNIQEINTTTSNDNSLLEKNNNDEIYDENDYYKNLLLIIIYGYFNNPNYEYIKTILNAEKFAVIFFNDYNEQDLIYDIWEEDFENDSLPLFKDIFVNNNKENCFLVINNKITDLKYKIKLSDFVDLKNRIITKWPIELEVKLIERKNKLMTNLSFMFYEISSLNPETDFSDFDTTNITNMSYMFSNCSTMKKLPNSISAFETKNVNDMSYMFDSCSSLEELPDISGWNVKNVRTTDYMFSGCELINYLPDLSGWDIYNLEYINGMFKNCKSLKRLFNLEEWRKKVTKNVKEEDILEGCISLDKNEYLIFNNNIKNKFSSYLESIKNKCRSKLSKPSILLILFIITLIMGCIIFLLILSVYNSFHFEETNKLINNPKEYLINYTNSLNITTYEEEDIVDYLKKVINDICDYKYYEKDQNKIKKINTLFKPYIKIIENISKEININFDLFLKKEYKEDSKNISEENSTENYLLNDTEKISKFYSIQKYHQIFQTISSTSVSFIFVLIII